MSRRTDRRQDSARFLPELIKLFHKQRRILIRVRLDLIRSRFNELFSQTELVIENSVLLLQLVYNLQVLLVDRRLLHLERVSGCFLRYCGVGAGDGRFHLRQLCDRCWLVR